MQIELHEKAILDFEYGKNLGIKVSRKK